MATRFFKTRPGETAEGDTFIDINVPTLRTVSREFRALPLDEIRSLLNSPVHEGRHLALTVLVFQVSKSNEAHRKRAFDLSPGNTRFVNNWALVDCSAPQIVGGYSLTKPKETLYTPAVSELLMGDAEDLIHKATGWTLREVGGNDHAVLEGFLHRLGSVMPRTMLRYAIEKFPPDQRRAYLRKKSNSVGGAADGL